MKLSLIIIYDLYLDYIMKNTPGVSKCLRLKLNQEKYKKPHNERETI